MWGSVPVYSRARLYEWSGKNVALEIHELTTILTKGRTIIFWGGRGRWRGCWAIFWGMTIFSHPTVVRIFLGGQ